MLSIVRDKPNLTKSEVSSDASTDLDLVKMITRALTNRMHRFLVTMAVIHLFFSSTAEAAENDYSITNVDWNGLAIFHNIALEKGFQVDTTGMLDFKELKPSTALVIIYPTASLPIGDLTSFMEAGGMVVLADDFGKSSLFLKAFGIKRRAMPDHHMDTKPEGWTESDTQDLNPSIRNLYRGSFLHPMAKSNDGSHTLAKGVEKLVLNHPAVFESKFTSIFFLEKPKHGVVLDLSVGKGRLTLISDPSVLINLMLRFPGNRRFASNLLGSIKNLPISELMIFTHNMKTKGSFSENQEKNRIPQAPPNPIAALFLKLQHMLREWTKYRMDLELIIPLSVLLCGVLLVFLAGKLPTRKVFYDGHWISAGERPPTGRFHSRMNEYASKVARDYTEPACLLRDQIDRELEQRLKTPSPLILLKGKVLADLVAKEYNEEAARFFRQLYPVVKWLPPTETLGNQVLRRRTSMQKLQKIDSLSRNLLNIMDSSQKIPK